MIILWCISAKKMGKSGKKVQFFKNFGQKIRKNCVFGKILHKKYQILIVTIK